MHYLPHLAFTVNPLVWKSCWQREYFRHWCILRLGPPLLHTSENHTRSWESPRHALALFLSTRLFLPQLSVRSRLMLSQRCIFGGVCIL